MAKFDPFDCTGEQYDQMVRKAPEAYELLSAMEKAEHDYRVICLSPSQGPADIEAIRGFRRIIKIAEKARALLAEIEGAT